VRNWEGCWRIESCPWMRIRAGGSTHRRTIRIHIQRLSGRALQRRESIETTFGQPRNSSGQSPEGCMGWALRCFSLTWAVVVVDIARNTKTRRMPPRLGPPERSILLAFRFETLPVPTFPVAAASKSCSLPGANPCQRPSISFLSSITVT